MDVLFVIAGLIFMIYIFRIYGRQKKPVKAALINISLGVALLIISNIILSLCNLAHPVVNGVTTFISAVFGVPGTIFLVVLSFIIQ